ncbi:MAG: nuclear transport factor 2 family protein [Holophagaceae bacterium]|jgi:ketosteroid isomerase-like protein|nr:DUF4440 domain-containing protein [Acidobacteriota bacterium]
MRSFFLSILSLGLFAQDLPQALVNQKIDAWHQAASRADEKAYFDLIHPAGIFMGTDAQERWTKNEFLAYTRPIFSKGVGWSFKSVRRVVSFSTDGQTAWFDEDLHTPNLGPARGTGVMVQTDTGWKIIHYNLTVTIPNPLMPKIKNDIELFLKKTY